MKGEWNGETRKVARTDPECEAIQTRLNKSAKTKKVKTVLRFVDTANDIDAKHDITGDTINKLNEKLSKAGEIKQSAITSSHVTKAENVIFENKTQDEIASCAKSSSGPGGPAQIDMETWKETICSTSYGTHSQKLAYEIATLAKHLATATIPHHHISTLLAYRLVPQKRQRH